MTCPRTCRRFYAFHSCLMEPWDGPAAVAFTDGRVIGATLDRNGLRPGRWLETTDGWVVLGSETGVMDVPAEQVKRKGRLQPGKLFLVDLERGVIVDDAEVKREVAGAPAVRRVVRAGHRAPRRPARPRRRCRSPTQPLHERQRAFGFTQEDLRVLLAPTAAKAEEPIGSMGNDAALAVLSDRQPPLFSYFKQLFAQVTNPPIDPIRESIVMSPGTGVGSERNLLDETPEHAHQLVDADADPVRPRAGAAAPRRQLGLQGPHGRHHVAGLRGPGRHGDGARARLPRGRRRARRRHQHPDPLRSRASAPSGPRSRRCSPSPACTTTWCARARACRPGSCSSPASRARSTTSRR